MARYGLGQDEGLSNLKDRQLVPPPVMVHPNRWRFDQLLAWEEKRMELAEAVLEALVDPCRDTVSSSPTQATTACGWRSRPVLCLRAPRDN